MQDNIRDLAVTGGYWPDNIYSPNGFLADLCHVSAHRKWLRALARVPSPQYISIIHCPSI
jgi:hypothetical protein